MPKPIVFIDSGIGGLPYCKDFMGKNPQEEICFIADRQNFPYGPRSKDEVTNILISLTEKILKKFEPKIIVLACNTATVSALDILRRHFPDIPFVGTVPAIKPASNASKTGKIGLLGTERTIEDPYNQEIINNIGTGCEIIAIAAPDLVEFIEHRLEKADGAEKEKIVKKYIDLFRSKNADTLVLGCTHFLHLIDEFRRESSFVPSLMIFESMDGITKRIEYLLDEKKLRAGEENAKPSHKLIITGNEKPDSHWIFHAQTPGFGLSLLCDI